MRSLPPGGAAAASYFKKDQSCPNAAQSQHGILVAAVETTCAYFSRKTNLHVAADPPRL